MKVCCLQIYLIFAVQILSYNPKVCFRFTYPVGECKIGCHFDGQHQHLSFLTGITKDEKITVSCQNYYFCNIK